MSHLSVISCHLSLLCKVEHTSAMALVLRNNRSLYDTSVLRRTPRWKEHISTHIYDICTRKSNHLSAPYILTPSQQPPHSYLIWREMTSHHFTWWNAIQRTIIRPMHSTRPRLPRLLRGMYLRWRGYPCYVPRVLCAGHWEAGYPTHIRWLKPTNQTN